MTDETEKKMKRLIHNSMVALRNIGPTSSAQYKFELERSSFDRMDDDDPLPAGEWVIIGRIYPRNANIYGGKPLRIQITITRTYPGTPPVFRLLQRVFHPNVMRDGTVCLGLLLSGISYKPSTSLVEAVADVTKLLDDPSIDLVQHTEAAGLRASNPAAYEAEARKVFAANQAY